MLSLTKGLASDLSEKKIRVNTVVPGLVKTELWDKQGKTPEEQKEIFEKGSQQLPVGFVATGKDIAEAYLYAIRADYATGTLIEIGESRNQNESHTADKFQMVAAYCNMGRHLCDQPCPK